MEKLNKQTVYKVVKAEACNPDDEDNMVEAYLTPEDGNAVFFKPQEGYFFTEEQLKELLKFYYDSGFMRALSPEDFANFENITKTILP